MSKVQVSTIELMMMTHEMMQCESACSHKKYCHALCSCEHDDDESGIVTCCGKNNKIHTLHMGGGEERFWYAGPKSTVGISLSQLSAWKSGCCP